MKASLAGLALLMSLACPARAQDHLVPDASAFVDPNEYLLKLRHVFAQAFEEGVKLRALVIPSFQKEYVVGLQTRGKGVEAFVLEPTSIIWDTELVRLYEKGEIKTFTHEGGKYKEVPPEKSVALKRLKEKTPADYRNIKATRRARPIPGELAGDIEAIWTTMLLDVRHVEKPDDIMDGVTYHFSARIGVRGEISGQTDSPEEESKTGRLAALADAMGDYARGKVNLDPLKEKLEPARRSIHP